MTQYIATLFYRRKKTGSWLTFKTLTNCQFIFFEPMGDFEIHSVEYRKFEMPKSIPKDPRKFCAQVLECFEEEVLPRDIYIAKNLLAEKVK